MQSENTKKKQKAQVNAYRQAFGTEFYIPVTMNRDQCNFYNDYMNNHVSLLEQERVVLLGDTKLGEFNLWKKAMLNLPQFKSFFCFSNFTGCNIYGMTLINSFSQGGLSKLASLLATELQEYRTSTGQELEAQRQLHQEGGPVVNPKMQKAIAKMQQLNYSEEFYPKAQKLNRADLVEQFVASQDQVQKRELAQQICKPLFRYSVTQEYAVTSANNELFVQVTLRVIGCLHPSPNVAPIYMPYLSQYYTQDQHIDRAAKVLTYSVKLFPDSNPAQQPEVTALHNLQPIQANVIAGALAQNNPLVNNLMNNLHRQAQMNLNQMQPQVNQQQQQPQVNQQQQQPQVNQQQPQVNQQQPQVNQQQPQVNQQQQHQVEEEKYNGMVYGKRECFLGQVGHSVCPNINFLWHRFGKAWHCIICKDNKTINAISLLACTHVLCTLCANNSALSRGDHKIMCPTCRSAVNSRRPVDVYEQMQGKTAAQLNEMLAGLKQAPFTLNALCRVDILPTEFIKAVIRTNDYEVGEVFKTQIAGSLLVEGWDPEIVNAWKLKLGLNGMEDEMAIDLENEDEFEVRRL